MAILLSALYENYKDQYQLRLVAGVSALSISVSWVYVLEDLNNIPFLRGNELLISTGLAIRNHSDWLWQLIKALEGKAFAGLILNVGSYIKNADLTPDILAYCDEHQIPLLTMPWKIHISDIMQDMCTLIFMSNYQKNQLTTAFQSLMFPLPVPQDTLSVLAKNGFMEKDIYTVLHIQNLISAAYMERLLTEENISYHLFVDKNRLVLVLHNCSAGQLQAFIRTLSENTLSSAHASLMIGVGETVSSVFNIRFSYESALTALKIAQKRQQPVVYFDRLGLERLLLSIPDKQILLHFYEDHLKNIEKYDQKNHTELLHTLETYLSSGKNISDTASALYTHRNTIHHRLRKISELLDTDLNDPEISLMLSLAFRIRPYILRQTEN